MKKLILILFVFSFYTSFSQGILIPRSTNSANTLTDERLKVKQIFGLPTYRDTTAANLKKGEDSSGSKIFTYGGGYNQEWTRFTLPNGTKKWIRMANQLDVDSLKTSISNNGIDISNKVDKITGKSLSTNDYDNTEKSAVALIPSKLDAVKQSVSSTIAGLRAINTQSDVPYQSTDFGGGIWKDIGINNGITDDGALNIRTANNHVLVRVDQVKINPQWFGVLPTNSAAANSTAIATMIAALPNASILSFPNGAYSFSTTITISKTLIFEGQSMTGTVLLNTGVGVDLIHINNNVQNGSFRNIGLLGNGTTDYGTNATSGKGVVFGDNTSQWEFDKVFMRGHGEDFFYANGVGNVNNIIIKNCMLQWGPSSCFTFIQSNYSNQVNAIVLENNTISDFGKTPVKLWGNSITFTKNTIQGSKGYGISVNGDFGTTSSDAAGMTISSNYFELCDSGFIYGKGRLISSTFDRYLYGLTIKGNFGTYNRIPGSTVDPSNISLVEIAAPEFSSFESGLTVSALTYAENTFQMGTTCRALFNGNNILPSNCKVQLSGTNITANFVYHINLGRAEVTGGSIFSGIGPPENSVTASIGSIYMRRDGSTGTSLYIKQSGTGNTGWMAVANTPATWTLSGSDVYYNSGNVGIGTPSPSLPLVVTGNSFTQAYFYSSANNTSGGIQIGNNAFSPRILITEVIDTATAGTTLQNQAVIYGINGLTKLHFGSSRSTALFSFDLSSGNLAFNNAASSLPAQIEMNSTNRGFLPPRMNRAQFNSITATQGLMVYDKDNNKVVFNNGSGALILADTTWTDGRYRQLTDATQWIKSSTNLTYSLGNVGIGTATTPGSKFSVTNTSSALTPDLTNSIYVGNDDATNNNFSGIGFGQTTNGNTVGTAFIGAIMTSHTAGSRTSDIVFYPTTNNTPSEVMRIKSTGAVGVGTTSPSTSALFDITSTTKGVLLPRMTEAQRAAITGTNGLLVYANGTNKFKYYDSTLAGWRTLIDSATVSNTYSPIASPTFTGTTNIPLMYLASGAAGTPSLAFSASTNSGLFWNSGLAAVSTTIAGTEILKVRASGLQVTNVISPSTDASIDLGSTGSRFRTLYTSNSIGIGQSTINANAVLDIVSTTKGILIPRMDRTQFSNITATQGNFAYSTLLDKFVYNNGSVVKVLDDSATLAAKFRPIADTAASGTSTATIGQLQKRIDSLSATLIKTGIAFFSGNGATTTFDITLPSTPIWANAEATSTDASGITYRTPITGGIRIFYTVPPPTGSNNISITYMYK